MAEATPALNALRIKLDGALNSLISDEAAKRAGNGNGSAVDRDAAFERGYTEGQRLAANGEQPGDGPEGPVEFSHLNALKVVARHVKEAIAEAVAPLLARIQELEARPSMKYEGVWDAQKVYRPGDCVTCSGVLWHADGSSVGQHPGEGAASWRLMHKTKGAR